MNVDDGWVLPDERAGERALELQVARRPVLADDIDDGWVLPAEDPQPAPGMHLTAFCRCGFVAEHWDSASCPRCDSALLLTTRTPCGAWRKPRTRRRSSHLPGIHARAPKPRPLNRVPAHVRPQHEPVPPPRANLHLGVFLSILLAVTALAGTATWLVLE